jgi:sugar phosphate isomerase/epimerase
MTRGGKAVGLLLCTAGLALTLLCGRQAVAVDFAQAIQAEYRVGGWAIGCQAYSFNRYSFFEAVDKTKETGGRVIEVFPGQKLSPDNSTPFNHDAPQEVIDAAMKKMKEAGVLPVAYGVVGLGKDEAANRKVFDFCKKVGILVVVSEPPEDALAGVAKMAQEYGIPVALHNHPKPSRYWDPKHVLECVKDLGPWVGSCSDTGHWMRSDVNPLEAIKMLEGHIVSMHIKDLNQSGQGAHDVPFGTGKADMAAILDELKRQKWDGPMSIEYEYNWTTSVPEITQCIDFMRTHPKGGEGEKAVEKKAGRKGGKKRKAAQP